MKDELIKFETAKLAKEKGFDAPCRNYFLWNERNGVWNFPINANEMLLGDESNFNRPTQSLLQRWLRDVHGIHIAVNRIAMVGNEEYSYAIFLKGDNDITFMKVPQLSTTYELALESALLEALNLIQTKP